jgi:hypothetical protein
VSVAAVTFGVLAVITAEPVATPVTGMSTEVEPLGIVNDEEETVATAVLLELTVNVRPPAGAGPESVRVRFCVLPTRMLGDCGVSAMLAATCTACVAEVYVGAVAVIVALPGATPVTCGAVAGVVAPAEIVTVAGEIETTAGLLLDRATVTAVGAGADKVTWNGADWPRPILSPEGSAIVPPL